MQRQPVAAVIMHIAGRHQRHARPPGQRRKTIEPPLVVRPQRQLGQKITAIAEQLAITGQITLLGGILRIGLGNHHAGQQTGGMPGHVGKIGGERAFVGPPAALGDQARQAAIRRAIGHPQHDRRRVAGRDFGADDQFQLDLFGGAVSPHDAGQAIAIGDRQRGIAQLGGAQHQLIGMRGPFQKRKVGFAMQLGIARRRRGARSQRGQRRTFAGFNRIGHEQGS